MNSTTIESQIKGFNKFFENEIARARGRKGNHRDRKG